MKIAVGITLIITCFTVIACMIVGLSEFKKKLGDKPDEITVCTHQEGTLTYIISQGEAGDIRMRNYTLDSLEFVSQKKFLQLDADK